MTKLRFSAAAVLLAAAMLFGGCSNQNTEPNSGENAGGASDIGNSNSYDSAGDLQNSGNDSETGSDNNGDSSDPSCFCYDLLNIPSDFTDEDRELQEILRGLVGNAGEIDLLFIPLDNSEPNKTFRRIDKGLSSESGQDDYNFYNIIPEVYVCPDGRFPVPQTRAGIEELLLKYYTEQMTEHYMRGVNKGSAAENPDGTYSVEITEGSGLSPFLEIDGRMYRDLGTRDRTAYVNCETAKVTRKTADTIEFTYLGYLYTSDYVNYPHYSFNEQGAIKFENGMWKLDYELLRF